MRLSHQRLIIALAIIGGLVFLALFWRAVEFLAAVLAYAVWYRLF
jgi:hypothetical protein